MAAIASRRARHPAMHVYQLRPYETTALKRLAGRHATEVDTLDALLRGKVLVDLYAAVRQGIRASVESYSIKRIEALYGFERSVLLRDANACLSAFETWLELREPHLESADTPHDEMRDGIQGYNEDDCLSTLHLRDWLEARREDLAAKSGMPLPRRRPVASAPSEALADQVERVRAVMRALLERDAGRRVDA